MIAESDTVVELDSFFQKQEEGVTGDRSESFGGTVTAGVFIDDTLNVDTPDIREPDF